MIALLNYIRLPHVATYQRRWVRRLMIILTFPQSVVQSIYDILRGSVHWWRQP